MLSSIACKQVLIIVLPEDLCAARMASLLYQAGTQ